MERINKIIELHEEDPFNCQHLCKIYKILRSCMSKENAYANIFHNMFSKYYVGYTTMSDHSQVEKIK